MKVGLVGLGTVAYYCHVPALKRTRGVTLVAGADPDARARMRAASMTRIAIHEDTQGLLSRNDLDAVVIAVPTHLHAETAVAAADAGKHFYLEKPIAATIEEAHSVTQAVKHGAMVATIGFNRRFHPLFQQARTLLQAGFVGHVRAVQTTFCEPTPLPLMPAWKQTRATGGGVLLDLASHHLDLLRWFLNDEIAEVSARIHSRTTEQDSALLLLTMKSGVEVQSFFSFRAGLSDRFAFFGESGVLHIDRHRAHLTLRTHRRFGYGTRSSLIFPTCGIVRWWFQRLFRPSVDPSYQRNLSAFVQRVKGHEVPLASLDDGVCNLRALLAAEASARTSTPVHVDSG